MQPALLPTEPPALPGAEASSPAELIGAVRDRIRFRHYSIRTERVLGIELPWLDGIPRAKRDRRLPTVLTREEVGRVLGQMTGTQGLMARLQYGTGMRVMECVQLRVKDIDLERREIVIRQGKGDKDRVTMLPVTLLEPLRSHLARLRDIFEGDRRAQIAGVELPYAFAAKNPAAGATWGWQWLLPTSWKPATTFARCRSCSGTRT